VQETQRRGGVCSARAKIPPQQPSPKTSSQQPLPTRARLGHKDRAGLLQAVEGGEHCCCYTLERHAVSTASFHGSRMSAASFHGTGMGTASFHGTGTGTASFHGTGTGTASFHGTGTGTASFHGTGMGTASFHGTGTGTASFHGTGMGTASFHGTGTSRGIPAPLAACPQARSPRPPRGGDCTDEQSSSSQTQPGPASVAKPGACRPIATCRRCSIARWRQKPAFGSPAAAGQAGAGRDLGGCGEGWGLRGAAGRRSGLPAGSRCLWHPDQPAAVQPGSRTRLPSISPGLRSVQVLSAEMPAPGLNSRQRSHTAASAAGPQPLTGEFC